ncbi:cytidine deaminase [Flavobacterium agricola]|uniref:Cytidine deaminase n=1 Tax=Flavobacterium agricola TaxID=2870839 RepID=A0ABY6LYR4_9FLAO|nr:cytidine deaminase [Flavobacterium agricola]UYW01473.1 cytidine deaminase [Flavobacterium agricola]
MREIHVPLVFKAYQDLNEMAIQDKNLMLQAVENRKKAYAPYSRFRVGAALLLENGEIVHGNNQENAAYPSGLCAERVAIFQAGALYPGVKILKIAISATSDDKVVQAPIPPCGGCRQSIAEYEGKQNAPIEIIFMGEEGEVFHSESLKNLLPLVFDKNFL